MTSSDRPVWAGAEPSLLAIRVAAGESPEWIAERTDALLLRLQSEFEVSTWNVPMDGPWGGSIRSLTALVQRHAVRGLVSEDNPDEALPGEGYSFTVSGNGPRTAVQVRVAAGNIAVGRRMPRRRLSVQLSETIVGGGIDARAADAVCAAVAETWNPATTEFADLDVRRLARRGNWKIGVGYRTWINSALGTNSRVAEGLTTSEVAGGTLISAPDDWSAEQVVAAMLETLNANELDEVPH